MTAFTMNDSDRVCDGVCFSKDSGFFCKMAVTESGFSNA